MNSLVGSQGESYPYTINHNFNELKNAVDLLSYAASFGGKAKKIGHNLWQINPCPICQHNDSFRIYEDTNSFCCWGGGQKTGGSIIDFIMYQERVDIAEAIKKTKQLAELSSKKFDREKWKDNKSRKDAKPDVEVLPSLIEEWYKDINKDHYLTKKRKIPIKLIDKYKIGFDLERNYIILPIYSKGKPVSYISRMPKDGKSTYRNSFGSPKIFNEDLLASNQERIFISEGYINALTLEKITGKPAIAINGSANIDSFIKKIQQYQDSLIDKFLFYIVDKDEAGYEAANKLKKAVNKIGLTKNIYNIELAENFDPNDYLRNNNEKKLKFDLKKAIREQGPESRLPKIWTGQEIAKTPFPDPPWVIPGLIPTGLTVIAGKPKIGKSWLSLHLTDVVSHGGYVFRSIKVKQQGIAYLALEDNPRTIKNRMKKVGIDPNEKSHFITGFRRGKEGLADLRFLLKAKPEIKVIIIDTLYKFRGPRKSRDIYGGDYEFTQKLQGIALEKDIAIIIIHHKRKASSEDFLEEIGGSFGVTGGVDTVIGLNRSRGQADLTMQLTGRFFDEPEKELALRFDTETGWKHLGDAEKWNQTKERIEVMKILEESKDPLSTGEVADLLNKNGKATSYLLRKLSKEGLIKNVGYGKYSKEKS